MATQILLRATEARLSGNTKCVLIELARLADKNGMTDVLSYQVLSESVGVGVSTVHHAINRLLDRGYVVRVQRVAKVGSKYQVLIDRDALQGVSEVQISADREVCLDGDAYQLNIR
jgi:DNA-binding transcriptional MocR family regulator